MKSILIKNIRSINTDRAFTKDVLIVGNQIARIDKNIDANSTKRLFETILIDGSNKILIPGLIDIHSHFIGASGESGYETRAPEIPITSFIKAGITTVVGLVGLDSISRHPTSLLAKTRALENEGITAKMLIGSYHLPIKQTITGDINTDIYTVPEIVGVGEIAISDVRSSQPTTDELRKLIKETIVFSKAKGIKGIVTFHLGDEKGGLDKISQILEDTDIGASHIITTHINRNKSLMKQAKKLSSSGVILDLTAIYFTKKSKQFLHVEDALKKLLKDGVPIDCITVSSDSGCLIEQNTLTKPEWLFLAFKNSITNGVLNINQAVRIFSYNPAIAIGFEKKGMIKVGNDADLVILDKKINIETVISKGIIQMQDTKLINKGFYSDNMN